VMKITVGMDADVLCAAQKATIIFGAKMDV
jgi:hypothetical protein